MCFCKAEESFAICGSPLTFTPRLHVQILSFSVGCLNETKKCSFGFDLFDFLSRILEGKGSRTSVFTLQVQPGQGSLFCAKEIGNLLFQSTKGRQCMLSSARKYRDVVRQYRGELLVLGMV